MNESDGKTLLALIATCPFTRDSGQQWRIGLPAILEVSKLWSCQQRRLAVGLWTHHNR